ncbi:MAG: CRISPR-associated endonuclease Cas2 [Ktedonobacteraceae bacterium]
MKECCVHQTGVSVRGIRQSSLYVVAYDISDDKRRTKIHKILKGFGQWTEFSLFECFLTKKELLQMQAKLDKYLDSNTDKVRIYLICDACMTRIETIGIPEPKEATSYVI